MNWITDLEAWDGRAPAALVALDLTRTARHGLLRRMAARALHRSPDEIAILHRDGRGPVLVEPEQGGITAQASGPGRLALSLSSRGRVSAMAVATGPMGIDVELVEAHRDVPWAILHPVERTRLEAIPAGDRARAFARLWSVKEAYLKALRWGLTRPPDEIRVDFIDHQNATVDDPYESRSVRQATTVWREAGGSLAALSAVLLRE